MKIAFVTGHKRRAGAEIAAARLDGALRKYADGDVRWFVRNLYPSDPNVVSYAASDKYSFALFGFLELFSRAGAQAAGRLHTHLMQRNLKRLLRAYAPDIIHIHSINQWTKTGFSRDIAVDLTETAPVAWTLHDLWALNGRWCYPPEFCSAGESPLEDALSDQNNAIWKNARYLMALIAPSRWVYDSTRAAAPKPLITELIPHGCDLYVFRTMEKTAAREVLNIRTDLPVLFCAAADLSSYRKGMRLLIQALENLSNPVCLMLAGKGRRAEDGGQEAEDIGEPHQVISLGPVMDERLLAVAYACADIVIVPSIKETFGNVAMEALACGRPVVCFKDSGVDELVQAGVTGDVVNEWSGTALASSIDKILPIADGMSSACRQYAEQHFSLEQYADRHMQLYRKLISAA